MSIFLTFRYQSHPIHAPPLLAEIMEERASELVSRAEEQGQQLEVLWSGGIDSTSLLVALLRRLLPGWRPGGGTAGGERALVVRCSADSVAEYPWPRGRKGL